MTNLIDFDRSLGDFLADGPNTAPEAPVIAALAHARTTPRRRDPLSRLRSDVMARPRPGTLSLRPGLALAAVALAVAAVGVTVIGSPPQDLSIPPGPSASPMSSASAAPSPSATPSSSASPSPFHVVLAGQCCNEPSIDVVDLSGHLTAVVAAPSDSITEEDFTTTNDDPQTVRLTWTGSPCDTVHRLTVAADFELALDRPKCFGDSVATFRAVLLTFDQPVDGGAMSRTLMEGRGEGGLPTWTAAAPDAAGNGYTVALYDPAQHVEALEGSFDPEVEATGAGPTGIQLVELSATSYRLIWLGPACAASPALTIDASGDRWQLANAPCAAPPAVLRMIDVTLRTSRVSLPTIEAVATP